MVDNKTLAALKSLLNNGGGGGGGGGVQSDWNQMDDTAADFIKNKPFGDIFTVVLEEQELAFDPEGGLVAMVDTPIQANDTVTVVFDGVEYTSTAVFVAALGGTFFGNLSIPGLTQNNTGEPFCGAYMDGMLIFITQDEANHTVKVSVLEIAQIPDKYFTVVKFYINPFSGKYLYTDFNCTTKATMGDMPDHANINIGYVPEGLNIAWYSPNYVTSQEYNTAFGYGSVTINMGGTFDTFYTAEYTPET